INLTNQVDWSLKSIETTDLNENGTIEIPEEMGLDTNENGIIDSGDVFAGHDSDGDGIPDQGQSPTQRFLNFLFLGIAIMFGPWAFYTSKKQSDLQAIERRLPDFLRDVAEAGRFGMTLADAIVVASSGRYGKLTPEIKKMAAQIEWGVPASETLRLFSDRINTPLVARVVTIVIKASDAGGSVADVLTMVAHDTKEEQLSQKEREIQMSTYLAVIYISFFVFLVTIIILSVTFLPKIRLAGTNVALAAEEAGISGGVGGASLDVSAIPSIEIAFFLSSMIHAIGDGAMAGALQTGSIPNGLRHSTIMLIMGFVILLMV
ncbi:MAG: type II secretion system F family protein, partial [Thermoplasmata archaeon]|nr:type II secretion system F family protein [Thermoplasmata archaeon]